MDVLSQIEVLTCRFKVGVLVVIVISTVHIVKKPIDSVQSSAAGHSIGKVIHIIPVVFLIVSEFIDCLLDVRRPGLCEDHFLSRNWIEVSFFDGDCFALFSCDFVDVFGGNQFFIDGDESVSFLNFQILLTK